MYVASFRFQGRLVLKKAKKPAGYELAIDILFYSTYFT